MERDTTTTGKLSTQTISTHTLTWSVTRRRSFQRKRVGNFNSHAHVERDLTLSQVRVTVGISTHTLTWSVTSWLMVYACHIFYFNSHAHVERDTYVYMLYYRSSNFNSHAHVERDSVISSRVCLGMRFQLTRSRGA